jgi:hypothetical protein
MKEIIWNAPERMWREKSTDFYWIVGIIAITIAVISTTLGNTIFAILVLIGAFTMSIYSHKPPQTIEVRLTQKGIKIDKDFYEYAVLHSFWIEEQELHPRIILRSKKTFSPHIVALIDDIVDKDEVREFLLQFINEEKMSEPFLEKLLIYFGF